jgi:hypothetical protein
MILLSRAAIHSRQEFLDSFLDVIAMEALAPHCPIGFDGICGISDLTPP